jgi:hypothetical protein
LILFVETNFVLELAFVQEDHTHCRALLDLAKGREDLEMVLPASCIVEAYAKQIARQRERAGLHRALVRELNELSRSKPYARRSREVREITAFIATTGDDERKRLEAVLRDLYAHATVMPLDAATAADAPRLGRTRGLKPQDALVYASLLARLSSEDSSLPAAQLGSGGSDEPPPSHCFITRDEDFTDEDIRTDLGALGCKILFNFEAGLGYVRAHLP